MVYRARKRCLRCVDMLWLCISFTLTQRCAFQNCTAFYYSTVQNTNVSFHYAWSFVGFPTLLMFYSNGSANSNSCSCSDGISVSNEYFVNQTHGSVSIGDFEKSVAFAVVFRQLIEAEVDSAQGVEFFNFSSGVSSAYNSFPLDTTLASLSIIDNTAINLTYPDSLSIINKVIHYLPYLLVMQLHTHTHKLLLTLQVGTSSVAGQLSYLPRTHYTENSTTFDLIVQNFPYRSNTSRVVLEMYIVPGPALDATGRVQFNHSIDDEYTPSIFETCTYLFGGSYLQWKPISYQDSSRSSTTSQQAKYLSYQGLAPGDHGGLPRGLASAIFAPGTNVTRFYMVIGTSGDATYLSSEYFTW